MATKRPSLAESMKAVRHAPVQVIETPASPSAPAEPVKVQSRAGMKRATALLSPDEHRRLKHLSADTGKSIEALLLEAVTSLLERHRA